LFDCASWSLEREDGSEKRVLRLGAAVLCRISRDGKLSEQEWAEFHSYGEFYQLLDRWSAGRKLTLVASHDLYYDLMLMAGFDELARRDWVLGCPYTGGDVQVLSVVRPGRRLLMFSVTNLFPGSLEDLGDLVGLAAQDVSCNDHSDQQLMAGCRQNVQILVRAFHGWLAFLKRHDLGAFRITLGSAALEAYRHRYMDHLIMTHHDPEVSALEREAYFGGRSEAKYQGRLDGRCFLVLDVNSMYPSVMRDNEYPSLLVETWERISIEFLEHKLQKYALIADVDLDTELPWFPTRHDGRLLFPVGQFRTTLCTPELKLALDCGAVRKVHRMAVYKKAPLFRRYVDELYKLRREFQDQGQVIYAEITKRLLNSLYGKFGQWKWRNKRLGRVPPNDVRMGMGKDLETGEIFRVIRIGGWEWEIRRQGEAYHALVAIAAHVTSYTRVKLLEMMDQVPAGHLYYVNTDSLIVDDRGLERIEHLVDERRLGALKVQAISPWLEIRAPGSYSVHGRDRRAGIRADAEPVAPGRWLQWENRGLEGAIQEGDIWGAVRRPVQIWENLKIRNGIVGPDGWVRPIRIPAPLQTAQRPVRLPAEPPRSAVGSARPASVVESLVGP